MLPVTDVATMRACDAATIASGVPARELMWRAGEGIFASTTWEGRTAIVCGSGNNAGDGYVLALLLHRAAKDCTLFLLSDRFSEDGKFYYDQCMSAGIKTRSAVGADLSAFDTVVDCILGTGFRGEVTGETADVICAINQCGRRVISVDINSGLNGDSGEATLGIKSDLTVSIGTYKRGHFLGAAKDVIGALTNVDIGIPMPPPDTYLAELGDFRDCLFRRPSASHKGNFGYVSLIGGCPSYAGAVKLANLSAAALRAGCGVAELAVPDAIASAVAPYLLESTLRALPSDAHGQMRYDPAALDAILTRHTSMAVGMGWGRGRDDQAILRHILQKGTLRLVIDADGLNALSEMDKTLLQKTKCQVVLTPHLKEFERLSGVPIAEVLTDPVGHAKAFAAEYGVVLLLKGTCTVVTDGRETWLCNRGTPGMATAGSGDVLSGILAGLLGYNAVTPRSVACGAMIEGRAGELAAEEIHPISMLASDTVSHIAAAIAEMAE